MDLIISPSILSADFSNLSSELDIIEKSKAKWLHIDVMDGSFVPNITIGPVVIKSIRPKSSLKFDVHLMINEPERYIDDFIKAGADILTIHIESTKHINCAIKKIKDHGIMAGLALNPATPLSLVEDILEEIDLLLIMTVNPGFGGQNFIPHSIKKIEKARKLISEVNKKIYLQVDGGINQQTSKLVIEKGVDVLVAGSAIFHSPDKINSIDNLIKK